MVKAADPVHDVDQVHRLSSNEGLYLYSHQPTLAYTGWFPIDTKVTTLVFEPDLLRWVPEDIKRVARYAPSLL